MSETTAITEPSRWKWANREHLEAEIARLRLLLHRHALWLRQHWAHDSSHDDLTYRISDAQADRLLRGEDGATKASFYATDPDAVALGSSLASVKARIDAIGMELQEAGAPAALDVLTRLFGLSRFERDVFLLALAPELDSSFERLYAYVQDDLNRRHATVQLALTLLRASGADEQRRTRLLLAGRNAAPLSPARHRRRRSFLGLSQSAIARRRTHAQLRARRQRR